MRVISGRFKSRKLCSIKESVNLRPTTDKIKESIFDIVSNLFPIDNVIFLDLFAGSGAIGLEAISRGAEKVFFVENNGNNLKIIKKNIELLRIYKENFKIVKKNVLKFLDEFDEKIYFDLIFLDPPYNKGIVGKIFNKLSLFNHISDENLIIVEHSKDEEIPISDYFEIVKIKNYNDTVVSFIKKLI